MKIIIESLFIFRKDTLLDIWEEPKVMSEEYLVHENEKDYMKFHHKQSLREKYTEKLYTTNVLKIKIPSW